MDWYFWAILTWLFLFLLHFNNVFIMNRFFGKEWERLQTENLIRKHKEKLGKLEVKLVKSGALKNAESNSETK